MRSNPILPVAVKPVDARDLETKLEKVRDRIRRRAYDLYCRRGQKGSALEDWARAECECNAIPLAGVADEDNDIRITACVPGFSACDLTVDILPNEIVVEADRNGEIQRYKRFHLPARVDASHVEARLHGSELDVIAPKATNDQQKNDRE